MKASFDTGEYIMVYDGETYTPDKWKFDIDEEAKTIALSTGNSRDIIYEYDLGWDHGSFTTIEETNKMLSKFKLYREE